MIALVVAAVWLCVAGRKRVKKESYIFIFFIVELAASNDGSRGFGGAGSILII